VKLSTQHFEEWGAMTKSNSTPPGAVLVAIDMSKHRQDLRIERLEGWAAATHDGDGDELVEAV